MRRSAFVADVAIAVTLTIFVLIAAPGLAVVAILALAVVLVCAASYVLSSIRRRRRLERRTVARR